MNWDHLLCQDRFRNSGSSNPNDLRTEFEKDYHRIIGSASFRRLQDKTQVFPLDKSDFIRTRLTHSLEVSSYAKSLGQNISENILQYKKDDSFTPECKAAICDILQCAGLLHDIGNPPFGHFGETAIQEWFKQRLPLLHYKDKSLAKLLSEEMKQDFYHFEGNAQALRLVTKLHFLVDEHGMNLTKSLLSTIIKYPIPSVSIDRKSGNIKDKKMGYFYAERELFADIQGSLQTNGSRHPLAYILEASDDIAYKTADIEDAFKKGCISYEQLIIELHAPDAIEKCASLEEKNVYLGLLDKLQEKYKIAVQNKYSNPELYAIQNWVVSVQGFLVSCATYGFTSHYREIMNGTYAHDLFHQTFAQAMMTALGDIAYRYAFISAPIFKLEIAAETIINFLLDKFINAAIYYDTDVPLTAIYRKLMSLISDNYKTVYHIYSQNRPEEEKLYLRLLLITDSVCGMTDSYAKQLYQELNGIF